MSKKTSKSGNPETVVPKKNASKPSAEVTIKKAVEPVVVSVAAPVETKKSQKKSTKPTTDAKKPAETVAASKPVESTGTKKVTKKSESVKTDKKVETKQTESKKVDTKKADTKKTESKKADTKKTESKKADTKKADTKKTDTKKADKKPVKKAVDLKPEGAEGAEEEELPGTRYFKVMVDGQEPHGRFSGTKPKQAANKALTSIVKSRTQSGGSIVGEIKFSIVECTRKSKHKQYNYVGERIKLNNPMKVIIGKDTPNPKAIEYKYNNRVMKDKEVIVVSA